FCEKVPVQRTGAMDDKMKKHQPQRRDHKNRRNKGDAGCQRAFDFAPGVTACSAQMHDYCTARVADVVAMVRRSSCARRFTKMVIPKRTSPISNNACR